ncbi:hypothetical protein N7449_000458 [Penicillium cf. viridicatum]|uniref:Uncharacterized protein n=1 Tax=Penicillium cf. viridicatum TaxID=2972119 RepID=A0A9W9T8J9_9EURO|nr:hypothetical protein N7449_000458 [Penicillium cf. viridicatum]
MQASFRDLVCLEMTQRRYQTSQLIPSQGSVGVDHVSCGVDGHNDGIPCSHGLANKMNRLYNDIQDNIRYVKDPVAMDDLSRTVMVKFIENEDTSWRMAVEQTTNDQQG